MAARSTSGTGVVVSLVVFVLTTVFLLIMTIVFYAGKTEALGKEAEARAMLDKYVRPAERASDVVKSREAQAGSGQSVLGSQMADHRALATFVGADPSASLADIKASVERYGVGENDTLAGVLAKNRSALADRDNQIADLTSRVADLRNQVSELNARVAQMEKDQEAEIQQVTQQIATYKQAASDYQTELATVKQTMTESVDRNRDRYEGTIRDQQAEIDARAQEIVTLKTRLNDLEARISNERLRAESPDLMVDGHVIDSVGADDQVFIDRGRKHRIVLGMTFEVYDQAGAIQVNRQTNEVARGKASIQVVKVGDTTSTCKIVRSTQGRPIVRNDVIANAIYDANYKFKFLVHGKFDIDGDGKPTEAEANYLRTLVQDWGGTSITGEDIPGDLDFLVLGEEPPPPPPPPADASEVALQAYIARRQAHDKYYELKTQARDAQIPWLSANRFLILIGYVQR